MTEFGDTTGSKLFCIPPSAASGDLADSARTASTDIAPQTADGQLLSMETRGQSSNLSPKRPVVGRNGSARVVAWLV